MSPWTVIARLRCSELIPDRVLAVIALELQQRPTTREGLLDCHARAENAQGYVEWVCGCIGRAMPWAKGRLAASADALCSELKEGKKPPAAGNDTGGLEAWDGTTKLQLARALERACKRPPPLGSTTCRLSCMPVRRAVAAGGTPPSPLILDETLLRVGLGMRPHLLSPFTPPSSSDQWAGSVPTIQRYTVPDTTCLHLGIHNMLPLPTNALSKQIRLG
ncbi:hypothetical protein BDY17DRAFT_202524 [Neohortaea acidophila]|uniref:Uncharacterized protein n=1 Tax=Neohortaea acidophila TaxID=245834 RepID=A0A6A6PLY2_9PEZI|nr:uncharacterized protein BDY17DRAFT_202524 [Neohortaea acidophila]KAF2480915.1 hypothetical protein BDY17DRAFT_202524 [Neohortaea acidophila]